MHQNCSQAKLKQAHKIQKCLVFINKVVAESLLRISDTLILGSDGAALCHL